MNEQLPKVETMREMDRQIKAHPKYLDHIKENGKPELIEDKDEALEVAHKTYSLESDYVNHLGAIAFYTENGHNYNGHLSKDDRHEVARGIYDSAQNLRIKADVLGAKVSEAYKNGAEFLDLSSDECTTALAEAPVYRKAAIVKARKAVPGEIIVTITPDGVEEGRNTAGDDDHVVTGANGADFILPGEKFNKLYEETEETGVFQSRGMARIIDNPTGKKIGILAPWGEMQYGDSESKIAVQYDPQNPDVVGTDRYILDKTEFAAYKEA